MHVEKVGGKFSGRRKRENAKEKEKKIEICAPSKKCVFLEHTLSYSHPGPHYEFYCAGK